MRPGNPGGTLGVCRYDWSPFQVTPIHSKGSCHGQNSEGSLCLLNVGHLLPLTPARRVSGSRPLLSDKETEAQGV
jgi:hypothetical protein